MIFPDPEPLLASVLHAIDTETIGHDALSGNIDALLADEIREQDRPALSDMVEDIARPVLIAAMNVLIEAARDGRREHRKQIGSDPEGNYHHGMFVSAVHTGPTMTWDHFADWLQVYLDGLHE